MKKRGKNKSSKGSSKKSKSFLNEVYKNKLFLIIGVIILAIIVICLIIGFSPDKESGGKNGGDIIPSGLKFELTPLELVQNKDIYEGKTVTLKEAFIPSSTYIYIKSGDFQEKLFIDPRNKEYCLYFDLEGKLKRDTATAKEWIFYVDQFTCVKKR